MKKFPKISIITAVRNCVTETDDYLISLRKFLPKFFKEIILIDDGSDEDTKLFLQKQNFPGKLLRNQASQGFGISNNLGASHAGGEWLLFLNNDLTLTKGWSSPFDQVIEKKIKLDNFGCLGNIQIDPRTKKIDHSGVTFKRGIPAHHKNGEKAPKTPNEFSEFLAVTGACFLIKKKVFEEIGGFDQNYKTGFEDIDLCLRLRMLGLKSYVANKSIIFHKRSSTPQRNEYNNHNKKIFYGKWGKLITRFEEWERVVSTHARKTIKGHYILECPEKFLFADQALLAETCKYFIKQRQYQYAQKVLTLLQKNFGNQGEYILLKSCLLRNKGTVKYLADFWSKNKERDQDHEINFEYGLALSSIGEAQKAKKIFSSLAKKGFLPGKCFQNIAKIQVNQQELTGAVASLRKALIYAPDEAPTWRQLSIVHEMLLQKENAISAMQTAYSFDRSIRNLERLFRTLLADDRDIQAYSLMANSTLDVPNAILLDFAKVCVQLGDLERGEKHLRKLIKNSLHLADSYFLMGNLMVFKKKFREAYKYYSLALECKPNWPEAFSNLTNAKTFLCDWENRQEDVQTLNRLISKEKIQSSPFELAGLHWTEQEEGMFAQKRTDKILAAKKTELKYPPKQADCAKGGLKQIGFLSSDFRNHAVGHQVATLMENLDRKKYKIISFATTPDDSSTIRKRIVHSSDDFFDLSTAELTDKAKLIEQQQLDLLIDLGGFSKGNNAELLALRPAVRLAHYLGFASSMGKGLVDYTIADSTVIPSRSSKHFGEKIIRMAGCFFPPGDFNSFAKKAQRKEVGLPTKGFIYCAFHAAYKLDPDIWACWMRILRSVPASILWLKFKPTEDAIQNLRAEAVRQGVSSKRIILAEDLPEREAHISRMAAADLYLDCPLYNGHASAMDALHAKLPILTIKGHRFCNRVGESFCKNLGLQEMVVTDLKAYEKKAIELGLDQSLLKPLRKKLELHADAVLSPTNHAKRFEHAIDKIIKGVKQNRLTSLRLKKQPKAQPQDLKDFTLVMIRPVGISNWAQNVSMLADELQNYGGTTMVIDFTNQKTRRSDFSKSVNLLHSPYQTQSDSLNHAFSELNSKYLFYLDDPLRVLPASHFIQAIQEAKHSLTKNPKGILGICSSREPHTGCLTTISEEKNKKPSGLFCPSFILNLEALQRTGGLRRFGHSLPLPLLDLSIRFERAGYRSSLLETDTILCPAHSADEYLRNSSESEMSQFFNLWNKKVVSIKPKHPSKDQQIGETADYQEWIRFCDTITENDILAFKKEADELEIKPLISVVMPVFNPPKKFLIKAIESVTSQAYQNWELCIADDASTKKYIRPLLKSYARKDSRIKVTFRKTNGHISVASNSAIKLVTGQFIAFLDHDDELRSHALLEIAKSINDNPSAKLIYSDEDKIDESGNRYDPYFKPDWDPDLLLGQNYISHLSVFEAALLRKLTGLRKGYEGSQDWDLTLRFTEQIKDSCILHVPKILYHWRAFRGSAAVNIAQKKYILEATEKVLNETFIRRKIKANLNFISEDSNNTNINYQLGQRAVPKVSILIPTKDRVNLLQKCIFSLFETIEYKNIEIIVIDNDSVEDETFAYFNEIKKNRNISVLNLPGEFNYSKINNLAAEKAEGEILLLLNNDIEAISKGWFQKMLYHAIRTEIGCVGAKLIYPNGKLQHGGVVVGLNEVAGHAQKFSQKGFRGYFGNLSINRNVSAVTGACLMIKKKIYKAVGGLDEQCFKVAFNDVDFCLRIKKLGYRNILIPSAELIHYESVSRGDDHGTKDKRIRFSEECSAFLFRWQSKHFVDPFYNPNLTASSQRYWFGLSNKIKTTPLSKGTSFFSKRIYDPGIAYKRLFNDLSALRGSKEATFLTVGGKSQEIGKISLEILREFGLECRDFLVDVGCGYGRLAEALLQWHKGKYLGTDVVPELLDYAKTNFGRTGRDFKLVDQIIIPVEDASVDMVCFFSVFTHLLHEQSFNYLKEVKRVLKIGGRVVFSFLDFKESAHIQHFEESVSGFSSGHPLNVFMSEGLIRAWADLLHFECEFVFGSEQKHRKGYPFSRFGQSIACLRKSIGSHIIPKQSLPPKLARNQYKETWNYLSNSFDSAKLHVTGEANEEQLKDSAKESIERINRYVKFTKQDTVLEIGCGIARVGKELATRCKKWIGCDISGNMLIHAQKRLSHLENIELVELPSCNLSPIPDNSIDVVYCTVVFMHLDEWDRYEYVKEAYRVLKPNGRAYFDNFSLVTEEGWEIFMAHYQLLERPNHISKSSTKEELSQYMKKSKFMMVKTELDDPWVIATGVKKK